MNIYCHICVKSNLWRRRQQRVWRKPLLISFKRLQVNESCDGSLFSFSNHSILTKDAKISARSKIPALRTTKIAYYNNIIWKLNIDINKAICKCKYELTKLSNGFFFQRVKKRNYGNLFTTENCIPNWSWFPIPDVPS